MEYLQDNTNVSSIIKNSNGLVRKDKELLNEYGDNILEGAKDIEAFFRHSFDSVTVNYAPMELVNARSTIGSDPQRILNNSDAVMVFYELQLPSPEEDDVLDFKHYREYIENQLLDMEQNSPAPDTKIYAVDFPPQGKASHKKHYVFLESVL